MNPEQGESVSHFFLRIVFLGISFCFVQQVSGLQYLWKKKKKKKKTFNCNSNRVTNIDFCSTLFLGSTKFLFFYYFSFILFCWPVMIENIGDLCKHFSLSIHLAFLLHFCFNSLPGEVRVGAPQSLDSDGVRCLDGELETCLDHYFPGWKLNGNQTWMVPPVFKMDKRREITGQLAEKKIFDVLHDFGKCNEEPMFVAHAVIYNEKNSKFVNRTKGHKEKIKGEHDFVIIHRRYGLIFFQVKAATTQDRKFAIAWNQLANDERSLWNFIANHVKSELRLKMGEEVSIAKKYVVMPNLRCCGSADPSKSIFLEDCDSVKAFSKWWEKNIPRKIPPDQEVYNCLVMR